MKAKHETINDIIKDKGYTSYLEVGVAKLDNFKHIKIDNKKGIDPTATKSENIVKTDSDEFFKSNKDKFDCIFIDGLHHAEQLEKDVINAYKYLNKGGCLILHDINPFTKEMAIVPRTQEQWTGDCFRVWAGVVTKTKLKTEYKAEKYGLGIIYKSLAKPKEGMTLDITYEEFNEKISFYLGE